MVQSRNASRLTSGRSNAAGSTVRASSPWAALSKPLPFIALLVICALLAMVFIKPMPEKVSVDFLYSKTCDYCTQARPIVDAAVAQMGGPVQISYMDGADRATNATVAAAYEYDKATGLFGGFPTLVAHGPKGNASLVGLRPQAEVQAFLCEQFVHPPPSCAK